MRLPACVSSSPDVPPFSEALTMRMNSSVDVQRDVGDRFDGAPSYG